MMYVIAEQIAYGVEKSVCPNFLRQKYLNIKNLKNH